MKRYQYSTYGKSAVHFEMAGIGPIEATRGHGIISLVTERMITHDEFERAHAVAQAAFDKMDAALKHSMEETLSECKRGRWK